MSEYSRIATGKVISTTGQTLVVLPFTPTYIKIMNQTYIYAEPGIGTASALWFSDMGQGSAFVFIGGYWYYIAPIGQTSSNNFTSGTGFITIQAALSLQYGPSFPLGTTGGAGIAKTSSTLLTVTTSNPHGLTTGNWVIFQNLYQTSTTGMQQLSGIPFMVTVTSSTTFTISWAGNSSNLTAITTAASGSPSFKQILYPVLYGPGVCMPWQITLGSFTTVSTTFPHNFQVGQQIAFRIPSVYGTVQLNEFYNSVLGSPTYYTVVAVNSSTQFVCNANSSNFTAYNINQPFASFSGLKFPYVYSVGDVNSSGYFYTGGALYPSPLFFNGFASSTTNGNSIVNGPAIQGSNSNSTFQGFIIGTGIVTGNAGDNIYYEALLSDINQ